MRKMYNFTAVFYPTRLFSPDTIRSAVIDNKLHDLNLFGNILVVPFRVSSHAVCENRCIMFSKHISRYTTQNYYFVLL
mgnify:CR=1 FL=1